MEDTATRLTSPTREDAATARITLFRRWTVAVPSGDVAVRLTLIGIAVALQNYLEFPRGDFNRAIGPAAASLLALAALSGSLVFLVLALRDALPSWKWLRSRRIQVLILLLTLAACPAGVHQLGVIAASGFNSPQYANDGTTLDHYAAQQVVWGHNPYSSTTIYAAVQYLGQDPANTTPLMQGTFAARSPLDYPSVAEVRAAFVSEARTGPQGVSAFESHVSYPALSFLALVPLVWAGIPSVVPFFGLCAIFLVALFVFSFPGDLRLWAGILALASTPVWDGANAGVLDLLYILLLFIAWRWWRKPVVSMLALGLAIAAKQLAWFFLPYYAIFVWQRRGWREAVKRLAGACVLFAVVNAPFIVSDAHAWLSGILAPEVDPMFPSGNGLIRLPLGGILPLWPGDVYLALELLALVISLIWYWRNGRQYPELAFVLAVVPLFFAWRSLTTYFYFIVLPAVALYSTRALREPAEAPDAVGTGHDLAGLTPGVSEGL